jgi:hypothetical protein
MVGNFGIAIIGLEASGSSEFICDRSSGPRDYHCEWHMFGPGKYCLLGAPYDPCKTDGHIWKQVDSIAKVIAYCATNLHPIFSEENDQKCRRDLGTKSSIFSVQ